MGAMAARVIDNDLDVSQAQILTPADYGIAGQPCHDELDLGDDLPIVLHNKPRLEKCTLQPTRSGVPELSSTFAASPLDVLMTQIQKEIQTPPVTPPKAGLRRCQVPDLEERCVGTPASSDRDSLYSTGADSDSLYCGDSCSDSCAEEDEDEEWFSDTSQAAVEARRVEELNSVGHTVADMMNTDSTTVADDDSDDGDDV